MAREDYKDIPPASTVRRRDFLKKAAGGAVGVGALAACGEAGSAGPATAEAAAVQGPEIQWRVVTSFPQSLDILHGAAERMAERVSGLTGGRFQMTVYAAGEIVGGLEVMDAVEQGTADAGLTPSYYYTGKNSALAFDTAVPFGLATRQHHAWLYHGGGTEMLRNIFSDFGIIQFPAANTGAQFGGWFRQPVESLADMNGLRMRIPGMGAEIMERIGVSTQTLAGGEIFPALDRGAIDATEWVGPYDDEKLGFYQVAPYYYTPGWWEPSASSSLQISMNAWNELPESYRHIIETVTRETLMDSVALYDQANPLALSRLVNDHNVQMRTYSDDILTAGWDASNDYLEEEAGRNPSFREVYDNWKAFRESSYRYFGGNEYDFQRFAFPRLGQNA